MKDLFVESIIIHYVKDPIRFLYIFVLCIIGKKNINYLFEQIELYRTRGHVLFFKSIYINYRFLPAKIAWKTPIYLYSKTEITNASGIVEIDSPVIYSGMIRWGRFDSYRSKGKTRIYNRGKIIFHGHGRILRGAEICVWPKAVLSFGDNFMVGENALICSQEKIVIGKYFRMAYNSQIFDTDFHYSINNITGEVRKKSRPIVLGDYTWIGNNCTLKKGTKTPKHTTIAGSYTVCNKDYTKETPEHSILGGIPAKVLITGYSRLWNNELERVAFLDKWFAENKDQNTYCYEIKNHQIEEYIENEC